jgi:hypothetical protein
MHWSAPSPLGAPPSFSGVWQPWVRTHTGALGLFAPRQLPHAYHAALTYSPYGYMSPPPYYDGSVYYPTPPTLLLPTLPSPSPPS